MTLVLLQSAFKSLLQKFTLIMHQAFYSLKKFFALYDIYIEIYIVHGTHKQDFIWHIQIKLLTGMIKSPVWMNVSMNKIQQSFQEEGGGRRLAGTLVCSPPFTSLTPQDKWQIIQVDATYQDQNWEELQPSFQ